MSKNFYAALFLAMALATSLDLVTGCRHSQSSNPRVKLAETLYDAAATVDTIADGLVAARHVIDNLETTEPEYYAHTKPLLQNIAKANDRAIAAVRAAKSGDASADWRTALLNVSDAVGKTDLTQFGFKNQNSQALVRVGFATLQSALALIPQNFGGQK